MALWQVICQLPSDLGNITMLIQTFLLIQSGSMIAVVSRSFDVSSIQWIHLYMQCLITALLLKHCIIRAKDRSSEIKWMIVCLQDLNFKQLVLPCCHSLLANNMLQHWTVHGSLQFCQIPDCVVAWGIKCEIIWRQRSSTYRTSNLACYKEKFNCWGVLTHHSSNLYTSWCFMSCLADRPRFID